MAETNAPSGGHTTRLLNMIKTTSELPSTIELDGNSLSVAQMVTVASKPKIQVKYKESITEILKKGAQFLHDKIEEGTVIYGVNTGFGGSADVRSDDLLEIQRGLLMLLNAGFGETIDPKVVKAVMVLRANSMCKGYSGVRPEIVDCLLKMVNEDIIPVVPKRGSISASGDLMPNSYIASCMMGRPDAKVQYKGETTTMEKLLKKTAMKPVVFQAKEALAVVNAASFGTALGAYLVHDASVAVFLTQACTALTVESLRGRVESFHPTIHNCMPHAGQVEVASNIRQLLRNSKLAEHRLDVELTDREGLLKQDRYALRTSAQWLSSTLETLTKALTNITIDLNSVCDNPLVDYRRREILHGGNFQGTECTVAMDEVRQALQICGKLLFAQFSEVVNVNMNNKLTPNLCGQEPRHDFGFKGVEIAMAAYMSELDYLTAPLTRHVLSAELNNQSVNSLALISARMTEQALQILQMMLACTLLSQAQAHDLRWLQFAVNTELKSMLSELDHHGFHMAELTTPWYEFAFRPINTGNALMTKLKVDSEDAANAVKHMENTFLKMLDDLKSGGTCEEIAACLGEGTRQLYLFIRKDLEIPYCCGYRHLDNMLEKIYNAVRERKMDNLIVDMFTCAHAPAYIEDVDH